MSRDLEALSTENRMVLSKGESDISVTTKSQEYPNFCGTSLVIVTQVAAWADVTVQREQTLP